MVLRIKLILTSIFNYVNTFTEHLYCLLSYWPSLNDMTMSLHVNLSPLYRYYIKWSRTKGKLVVIQKLHYHIKTRECNCIAEEDTVLFMKYGQTCAHRLYLLYCLSAQKQETAARAEKWLPSPWAPFPMNPSVQQQRARLALQLPLGSG